MKKLTILQAAVLLLSLLENVRGSQNECPETCPAIDCELPNCCLSGQVLPGQYDHCGCLEKCAPVCIARKDSFCTEGDICEAGFVCETTSFYLGDMDPMTMSMCLEREGNNEISHATVIEICESPMDDPSLTAALAKSVEGIVSDDMMEEMNVMMEAMVTFMETGEIDDLKPMLEKVQNVETHVDETMKNMGMNSTFDEMSQEVVVAMETQMAEVQNNMNEIMGITTAKSEAAIAEDDENRVVVTAKPTGNSDTTEPAATEPNLNTTTTENPTTTTSGGASFWTISIAPVILMKLLLEF